MKTKLKIKKTATRMAFLAFLSMIFITYSGCEKYVIEVGEVGDVSFSTDIEPIFVTNCSSCHPSAAGLDFTEGQVYSSVTSNSLVDLASPEESSVYTKINSGHGNLTTTDKNKILAWIEKGALDD
ncbi:hypothetical protein ACFLT1_02695 [Bacteroidota bacterium]